MNKIKGGDLMLFLGGKSIAFATSHSLEITGETTDTSNKDEGAGDWSSQEVSILSWSASSENLYSEDGAGDNFDDLFDLMIAKTPIDAVFAKKSETTTDVPEGGWTSKKPTYEGKVVITSLSLNAPNGEYASYTATFQGVAALQKKKLNITVKYNDNVINGERFFELKQSYPDATFVVDNTIDEAPYYVVIEE